jgi:hypothetical protein
MSAYDGWVYNKAPYGSRVSATTQGVLPQYKTVLDLGLGFAEDRPKAYHS